METGNDALSQVREELAQVRAQADKLYEQHAAAEERAVRAERKLNDALRELAFYRPEMERLALVAADLDGELHRVAGERNHLRRELCDLQTEMRSHLKNCVCSKA